MGRYGTLKFITEAQVPAEEAVLIARMSWGGHLVVSVFLLGWILAIPIFLFSEGLDFAITSVFDFLLTAFSTFVIGIVGLVCLLAGLVFLFSALAAFRQTNWMLRIVEDGIYLKLRSYTDFKLPKEDRIVVFIPRSEIRRIGATRQKTRIVSRGGEFVRAEDTSFEKYDFLEITLYGPDLSALENCLTEEKARKCPTFVKGVTSGAKGAPIRILPKGILKIEWHTRKTRMTPGTDKTLDVLSHYYATTIVEENEQLSIKTLDKKGQEGRLIELAATGNIMDAVMLSRELYGYTLTEAKQFVEGLLGSGRS